MADPSNEELQLLKLQDWSSKQDTNDDEREDLSSKDDGMNVLKTIISMSPLSCGFGSLAIAMLVASTGWMGLVTGGLTYATVNFTLVLMGRCWNMVRERYHTERHPYGAIGYEAYGSLARTTINVLVACCSFVAAASSSLFLSELIVGIGGPALNGYFCYFPIGIGIIVCPLAWLNTPKNLWLVSLTSFVCNVVAMLLIFISLIIHERDFISEDNSSVQSKNQLLLHAEIVGSLVFTTGMHYVFPTIQQDMKEPSGAGKAVLLTSALNTAVVSPLIVALFVIHGSTLNSTRNTTALTLMPDGAFKIVASSLLMMHLVQCILFFNNPLFQFLEEKLNIPTDFSWKRIAIRSTILLSQVFIQESMPHFILYFFIAGGFLMPPLAFFAPPLCYLRLRSTQLQESGTSKTPKIFVLEKIVCYIIMGVTPLVMVTSLYVTVPEIAGKTWFAVPCYVNATQAHP